MHSNNNSSSGVWKFKIVRTSFLRIFLLTILTSKLFAQAEISSVIPSACQPGQELDVIIRGVETNFTSYNSDPSQNSTVNFGNGITVISTQVQGNFTITAHIKVDANATLGTRSVSVTTGSEVASYNNTFEVEPISQDFKASLQVVPVQSITVSDFDINNINTAPLLFYVNIQNDITPKSFIKVVFVMKGSLDPSDPNAAQIIITGIKRLTNIASYQYLQFTNKDFDDYKLEVGKEDFFNTALQTGILPTGTYSFKLKLYTDEKMTNPILGGEDEGINILTNSQTNIELISPGFQLNESPELVFSQTPLFQWFGQANSYDLKLFEVLSGQNNETTISENIPIFSQDNLTTNSTVYPGGAYPLVIGKTYAWKIIGHVQTSTGIKEIKSPLNWFTIGGSNTFSNDESIVRLEVFPSDIELDKGDTLTFIANGFTQQENKIRIKAEWSVIPQEGGIVDGNGLFTAGQNAMSVAVIARYNGLQEYSTVKINGGTTSLDFDTFFNQVFGISN